MDNSSPIGFFDSGVGGLSVYSKFRELLPNENTIYFGDLKNLPYGNKTQDELVGFARIILDFFKTRNVKAVAIACNTSSALAYETIKSDYEFPIYPIIQSSAKVISSICKNRIGVFATQGTVSSGAYKNQLKKYNPELDVKEIACANWVEIVEGKFNGDAELDIKKHIEEMLEFNPEKIILGCTHYPYLLNILEKFAAKSLFIDPSGVFSVYIKEELKKAELLNISIFEGKEEFYVSANPKDFVQNAKLFYEVRNIPSLV